MALTLSQLIQPYNASAWNQVLLNGLQGVGPVTQAGMTISPSVVAVLPSLAPYEGVQVQIGTGSVLAVGPAVQPAAVVVQISTSGNCGTGAFNYSLDGGSTFNASGPFTIPNNVSSSVGTYLITAINVTLVFTNGLYATPYAPLDSAGAPSTFIGVMPLLGETYSFTASTPAFPVTNWPIGGVARTLVQADAQALQDLDVSISQIAAAGYAQSWITPPPGGPPPSGWLDLLSQGFYNRRRYGGAVTAGVVQLACGPNAGPYTQAAGTLSVVASNGQVFTLLGPATSTGTLAAGSLVIPRGGTVPALFAAVSVGSSFNSVISDNPVFTGVVSHTGVGTGTIEAIGTPYNWNLVIKVTTAGAVTTAYFDYSIDGGTTYTGTPIVTAASVTIPTGGSQVTLAFVGTFNLGDTYTPAVAPLPGSNVITQLVSPLSGVTVGNFLQTTPPIAAQLQPGSTGAIAIAAGVPNQEVQVQFVVTAAGTAGASAGAGVGTWSYQFSNQSSGLPQAPLTSFIPTAGVTIAGLTVKPSGTFKVGDTFSFSTSWLTQRGADPQSDVSLATADQNQWAQLSQASPTGAYENWALAGSPEVVSSSVSLDPVVPGLVDIVLIGANNGPVSSAAVTAVQLYIEQRAPLTVTVNVTTVIPATLPISGTGVPFICSPGSVGSVQQQIAKNLYTLQITTPAGGFIEFDSVIGAMAVAGSPGGIPGLIAVSYATTTIAGISLTSATPMNSEGVAGIQLLPSMTATITPPPGALFGTVN